MSLFVIVVSSVSYRVHECHRESMSVIKDSQEMVRDCKGLEGPGGSKKSQRTLRHYITFGDY